MTDRERGMKNRKAKCPICKKETVWEGNPFRPFCSERCRTIDLGEWATEGYRIPGDRKDLPAPAKKKKNQTDK